MSDATRHFSDYEYETLPESSRGSDLFVFVVVASAAIIVTLFALHGAPNLLGERFNPDAITIEAR